MKRLLLSCLLLAGCMAQSAHMNAEAFSEVIVGEPVVDVQERVGKPYRVSSRSDGRQEHIYIERRQYVRDMPEHLQYVLIVSGGGLVEEKLVRTISTPTPGDIDGR